MVVPGLIFLSVARMIYSVWRRVKLCMSVERDVVACLSCLQLFAGVAEMVWCVGVWCVAFILSGCSMIVLLLLLLSSLS